MAARSRLPATLPARLLALFVLASVLGACSRSDAPPAPKDAASAPPASQPAPAPAEAARTEAPEGARDGAASARPNIVLISVDTLRRDHMSAYGYERDTTPELEKLAREGARFDTAYAHTATTGPSHATMLTARLPIGHGIDRNGVSLRADVPTLTEILKDEGYQTAAFVSSYVLVGKFGYDRGFEEYDIELDEEPGDRELTGCAKGKLERCADQTVDAVIRWLQRDRDPERPLFLFIHLFDPHSGYYAPAAFREKFAPDDDRPDRAVQGEKSEPAEPKLTQKEKRAQRRKAAELRGEKLAERGGKFPRKALQKDKKKRKGGFDRLKSMPQQYDAEIAFADHELGRLLRAFDESGLRSGTIVMMTADHGEALGAHGVLTHGYALYEEVLRVPLLVRYPDRIASGIVIDEPVGLFDLMPTLLDLAGLEPQAPPNGGRSLAPVLLGRETLVGERPIYLQRRHYDTEKVLGRRVKGDAFGLRVGRWKYIESEGDGKRELYDLEADPLEEKNLIEEMPERADAMAKQIAEWRAAHQEGGGAPERQQISEADREKLRALGYVD